MDLWGHSAVHYKNKIFIFGGADYIVNRFNKVKIFNLETEKYSQAKVYGTKPSPMYGHTATIVEE